MSRWFKTVAVAGALLFLLGLVAGPAWLYAPLCHQQAERSFALAGGTLPVCARCSGLYLGGLLGLVAGLGLARREAGWPARRWFWWLLLPTALDGLLAVAGLSPLSNVPRFLLALPAGGILGLFLMQAIDDLVRRAEARPAWSGGK